jgi:hypothetical protein
MDTDRIYRRDGWRINRTNNGFSSTCPMGMEWAERQRRASSCETFTPETSITIDASLPQPHRGPIQLPVVRLFSCSWFFSFTVLFCSVLFFPFRYIAALSVRSDFLLQEYNRSSLGPLLRRHSLHRKGRDFNHSRWQRWNVFGFMHQSIILEAFETTKVTLGLESRIANIK